MAVEDIVVVNITVRDSAPSVANFGTPLIMSSDFPFLVPRLYNASGSGLAALVADGVPDTSRTYHLAQTIASQSPSCSTFYVHDRRTGTPAQTIDLTPTDTQEGFIYELDVRVGNTVTPISYTVLAAETPATIATALQPLIDAVAGVDCSVGTGDVTVTPTTPDTFFYLDSVSSALDLEDNTPDPGIATDLSNALAELGDSFYGILIDSQGEAEINAVATFAEANDKMAILNSADTAVIDGTAGNVGEDLALSNFNNTSAFYSGDMSGWAGAALMGRQFSQDPGTSNYEYQQLSGPQPDALSATEQGNATGNNVTVYVLNKGLSHTFNGRAASGRELRITRGIAWLKARLEEAIIAAKINNEIVLYDNSGFDILESEVRGVLALANRRRLILDNFTVTMPDPRLASQAEKAAGLVDAIEFTAVFPSAVSKTIINGSVTL